MALNADNVRVALTGSVLTAPRGTTLPEDTDATWNAAFVDLGYIHEDGVTAEPDDTVNDIPAWQGGVTVRRVMSSTVWTFAFKMLETTAGTLDLFYKGSEVEGTGSGPASVAVKSAQSDRRAFGIDVVDGLEIIRYVIPDGEVTEREALEHTNSGAVIYGVTITAYPDDEDIHFHKYLSALDGLPES